MRKYTLADEKLSGLGFVLQTSGNIGRIADGGVVHPQVVANLADHDHARVEPDAQPQLDGAGRADAICVESAMSQSSTVTGLRSPSSALRDCRIFSARCAGV